MTHLMRDRPELAALIAEAQAKFAAMTPAEQARHNALQRRSWVRGEMMLEHPEMTEEQVNKLIDQVLGPAPRAPLQGKTKC